MDHPRRTGDAYTHMLTHRFSTVSAPPSSRPSIPRQIVIPPSLMPGHRSPQSASPINTSGLLFLNTGIGRVNEVPAGHNTTEYNYFQPPLPSLPPPPLPPLPPPPPPPERQHQPVVPPLPPKAPLMSTSISPLLPPKPPELMPKLFALLPTQPMPLPKSQPPVRSRSLYTLSHPPSQPPPLPPMLPPKPFSPRPSLSVAAPKYPPSQNVTPSETKPQDTTGVAPITQTLPPPPPPLPEKLSMNEEEALALAIKLSKRAERERVEALKIRDEALIQATIQESLRDPEANTAHLTPQPSETTIDSGHVSSTESRDTDPYSPRQASRFPTFVHRDRSTSSAPSANAQRQEDEGPFRRLEADHESGRGTSLTRSNDNAVSRRSDDLPFYHDIVPRDNQVPQRAVSNALPSGHLVSPTPVAPIERPSIPSNPDETSTPRQSPSPAQQSSPKPEQLDRPVSPSEEEEQSSEASPTSQGQRMVATPNQYVEPELLYGLSFGVGQPPIELSMMQGSLPEVIPLHYGKCPPMHIHGRSWRQLLKLMAKMSGTQIEPSISALTDTKGELRLRTVIHFFKVHQASPDWRTVIYLTIDYPPPPEHRHTNADANVLPYSYSLSSLPTMLSDGPESPMSKYYTIPATARTPLPKLPIKMDSMANYLASALDDSRRAPSDASSGLRRLAKMVDQFYPEEHGSTVIGEDVRPKGGRALIGRLMGRSVKAQRGLGRNADVYDLVTPFVPDEWG